MLPSIFFFLLEFPTFCSDGVKTRTQTGNGNMISVPLSSGSWRKWYFIDRTSSRICSDRTDRKNAQINVRLCVCQCTRVCFTGKNNQPTGRLGLGGDEEGWESAAVQLVDAAALRHWERSLERLAVLFLCKNKHQLCLHPLWSHRFAALVVPVSN